MIGDTSTTTVCVHCVCVTKHGNTVRCTNMPCTRSSGVVFVRCSMCYTIDMYYVTLTIHSLYLSQTSIIHGKILRMGKGFTLEGIEGQDLAGLFHQAFARKVRRQHNIIPPFQFLFLWMLLFLVLSPASHKCI